MRYIGRWCLNTGCCMCTWPSLLLMINVTEISKLKRSLNFSIQSSSLFLLFSILHPGIMKLENTNYWQFWNSRLVSLMLWGSWHVKRDSFPMSRTCQGWRLSVSIVSNVTCFLVHFQDLSMVLLCTDSRQGDLSNCN